MSMGFDYDTKLGNPSVYSEKTGENFSEIKHLQEII
jgi:hypothetical protein